MKLQLLQMIQILIERRIMVGCRWWVYVCVGFVWCLCALCVRCGMCGVRVVCCACVLSVCVCGVCAEGVCGMCGGVRFVVWCVLSVCGAAWQAEKPSVCRFKTSPCVGSKRFRVYKQNARMCSTCGRFAGTHGSVLNLHMETFQNLLHGEEGERGFSSLSFSLHPSLPLFLPLLLFFSLPSSLSLLLFSSFVIFPFLFLFPSSLSLSITMTMITRPVGSLSMYTRL